jgi:hypothetical protein
MTTDILLITGFEFFLKLIYNFCFILLVGLAWAIGGEKHFGKGRRGLLLSIPLCLYTLTNYTYLRIFNIISFISCLVYQIIILYVLYQIIYYAKGINIVYKQKRNIGWLSILTNGFIIGFTPLIIFGDITIKTFLAIASIALFFCFAVMLSNDEKFNSYRNFLKINMIDEPYLRFKDAWYVSEFLIGAFIALIILILN